MQFTRSATPIDCVMRWQPQPHARRHVMRGQWRPEYRHRGDAWIAVTPGHRYAVRLTQIGSERMLLVDGVDAIGGKPPIHGGMRITSRAFPVGFVADPTPRS